MATGTSAVQGKKNLWERSIWGSRQSFVQARIEKEGCSPEDAEHRADVWEEALRELKDSPPEPLRPE